MPILARKAARNIPGGLPRGGPLNTSPFVHRLRLILAACVAATAVGCSCGGGEEKEPPPPAVELAEAVTGEMPEVFETIGTVESLNTVQVRARVSGQLLSIDFQPGEFVEAGQPLLQLDPRPFEQALEAAEAARLEAQTQARQLQADARRYEALARRGAVATQQAEQSRAAARAAAASVAAAEATVEQARLDLEYAAIEAPVRGRTGELSVRIGDQIQPGSDEPLVTIQVMDPIYVRFSLPADRLYPVREAMQGGELRVEASPRGSPEMAKEGVLDFIDNQVDPASGTILLKALFDNPDETFWPGEPSDVRLFIRTLENVVLVPSAALQMGPEGPLVYVYRPEDSTVEMRPIRPGLEGGGRTAVLEGIAPGEQVVVSGQLRLQPGMKVRLPERPPPETPAPDSEPTEGAPPEPAP